MSSLDQVLRLKQALNAEKMGEIPSEDEKPAYHTNRGHKLEPGSRFVSSTTLNVPDRVVQEEVSLKDETDSENEEKEELNIEASAILQPISNPAELPRLPSMRTIFTNPFLRSMSREMLDTLVEEKQTLSNINDLAAAFLGDDDRAIFSQLVGLVGEDPIYPTPEPGKPLPPVKRDLESFFKVPEPTVDADLGLEHDEAEELRQKLLVSQHLMKEYVRSMEEVRGGLEQSMRMRYDVLNWCREMNNEDYVKIDLDSQNNNDNAGLGERPAKDFAQA